MGREALVCMSAPNIDPGEPERRDSERVGSSEVGSSLSGLSAEEAARRFSLDGPNVLKQSRPVSLVRSGNARMVFQDCSRRPYEMFLRIDNESKRAAP
jgi:hypothetical protein